MSRFATEDEYVTAVADELEPELRKYDMQYDDGDVIAGRAVLESKVRDALYELRIKRSYQNTSMTEEQILADMENYYGIIKRVALVYYGKIGAYGELYHYENTVHRSYPHEYELWNGVHPFVKVFAY